MCGMLYLYLQHVVYLVAAWELLVVAFGILFTWPGIEPQPPALGAESLSEWTTRGVITLETFLLSWIEQNHSKPSLPCNLPVALPQALHLCFLRSYFPSLQSCALGYSQAPNLRIFAQALEFLTLLWLHMWEPFCSVFTPLRRTWTWSTLPGGTGGALPTEMDVQARGRSAAQDRIFLLHLLGSMGRALEDTVSARWVLTLLSLLKTEHIIPVLSTSPTQAPGAWYSAQQAFNYYCVWLVLPPDTSQLCLSLSWSWATARSLYGHFPPELVQQCPNFSTPWY